MKTGLPKRKKIKKNFGYSISIPEGELKNQLFEVGLKPIPQFQIGKYFIDLALPKYRLAIEYDGKIHLENPVKDFKRQEEIITMGWDIIRIMNKDGFYRVMFNYEKIADVQNSWTAMSLLVNEVKDFVVEKERNFPNYILNECLKDDNKKEIRKFVHIGKLIKKLY